jgi:hypothetical protein
MSVRKLGGLGVVAMVVGLVFAGYAYATPTTKVGGWITGSILEVGKSETAECSAGETFVLKTTIGGVPVKIQAKKLTCLEGKISEVENSGKMGEFSAKMEFTEATVLEPSGCSVRVGSVTGALGTIQTKPLTGRIEMEGSTAYLHLSPTSGTVLATIYLEGGSCTAIQGSYNWRGTLYGRFNPTGFSTASQPVQFSPAIETAGGGEIHLGENIAEFTGQARIKLGSGGTFKSEETPTAPATPAPGQWYVGGSKLGVGSSRSTKCSAAENFFVTGTILGAAAELKATGLECLSASIKQIEPVEGIVAELPGELKLTGVTVVKPSGCSIASTLTIKPAVNRVYMGGSNTYSHYLGEAGKAMATVKLEGCASAGSYALEGDFFGQWSATSTSAEGQAISFSEAIQDAADGSLLLGGEVAQLTGKATTELTEGGTWAVALE